MQLRFQLRAAGAERMLQQIVLSARDAMPTFRRWVGFMRKQARARFKKLSGPDLAPSTREKYEQTRTAAVTARGNVRASYARNAEAQLRKKAGGEMTIAELRRLARGGSTAMSLAEQQEASIERLRKQLDRARSTGKRVGGDRRKIDRHQLLGRLSTALQGQIKGAKAILENRVPWSGVHNEGGTAGKGARIPKRPTLLILAEDCATLAQIALDSFFGRKR